MATLIAAADGNFTAAATWGVVDATSLLYSVANSTVLTTAYVESQTFVPGAITIDGIAVYLANRVASPTGTISCRLAQAGATVAGTEVTINVSDVERVQTLTGTFNSTSFVFFKFAAPVLLVAATAYSVSLKTSNATQISAIRNATAGNWCRFLRTTTTGAPAAGDQMFVLGEWTAAATKTNRTVTMNETATTDYGSANTDKTLPSIAVSKGGLINWGTTAATNYRLRVSGTVRIWPYGDMFVGTTATPIPSDSTAELQFDCAADNDFNLIVDGGGGHGLVIQGVPRTAGKLVSQCLLNTDEAAAQTVLGVDTDTGWKSGDEIAIATTTRTATQTERRTLAADAAASTVTVTAGLASAHSGTSPTQAEVILLTRNTVVRGVTAGLHTGIIIMADATVDIDWCEFYNIGSTVQTGLEIRTGPAGSCSVAHSSMHDYDTRALYTGQSVDYSNISIDNVVFHTNIAASITNAIEIPGSTTASNVSFTNIAIIGLQGNAGGQAGITVTGSTPGVTITNLRVAGCNGTGIQIASTTSCGIFSGLHSHSNGNSGIDLSNIGFIKVSDIHVWRNNCSASAGGLTINSGFFDVDGGQVFGNNGAVSANIRAGSGTLHRAWLRNLTIAGDSTFSTAIGLDTGSGSFFQRYIVENCSFGDVQGIFTAHTSSDIRINGAAIEVTLIDTLLDSTTELDIAGTPGGDAFIAKQRHEGTTNIHSVLFHNKGTRSYETATFRTASPSEKLAPNGAVSTFRLESSPFYVRANSGTAVNVAAYVLKDASYSGLAARLMLRQNSALGVDADTLLDTHTVGINIWEQLAGTTPVPTEDGVFEFYVDITGTGGAVYVDDWSAA